MKPSIVLVVGRDPLLPQVVRHLLPQQTTTVVTVPGIDEALLHTSPPPRLAVVELPADEDAGTDLFKLRGGLGATPLILLSPTPDAQLAIPPDWQPAPRVLSKPLDLEML